MGNEMNSKGGMLLANGIVFGRGACVGQATRTALNTAHSLVAWTKTTSIIFQRINGMDGDRAGTFRCRICSKGGSAPRFVQ